MSKTDPMLVPGYLTTMFGTLYAALVMHSYVMSLVCLHFTGKSTLLHQSTLFSVMSEMYAMKR